MRAERVVLDTNILISAVLTPGKPFQVLHWVLEHGVLIFSDATFGDLSERLNQSKFDRYVGRARRAELLADLEAVGEWTAISGAVQVCRDPDDDKFLETALAADAHVIGTGDDDLLVLGSFEDVRIVTAAGFLEEASP